MRWWQPGPEPVVMLARPPALVLTALEHIMREWFHDVVREGDVIRARGGAPAWAQNALRSAPAGYLLRVTEDPEGTRLEVRLRTRNMKKDLTQRWQALVNIEDVLREVSAVLHDRAVFLQGGNAALRLRKSALRWAWITGGAISGIVAIAVMAKVMQAAFG